MLLTWCIPFLLGCSLAAARTTSFLDEECPVVSTICGCFSSLLSGSTSRRSTALRNAINAIDNAASDLTYHFTGDVISSSPWTATFIEKVQRLEYLVEHFRLTKDLDNAETEKSIFAEELLDLGSEGLPNVLHNIHVAIVGTGITSSKSILAYFSDARQAAHSPSYLQDTLQLAVKLLNIQTLGYTAGIWACAIKNRSICFDHFSSLLTERIREQDSFLTRKRVFAFGAPRVQSLFNWCSCGTCKPLMGDFNGDGKSDLLCFKTGGMSRLTTFDTTSGKFRNQNNRWVPTDDECEIENIYVGYYNRDRRSDVLCLKTQHRDNKMGLIYATSSGDLSSTAGWRGDHEFVTLCLDNPSETTLYTGDFNGDGRTDIMCHNHDTGNMRITHQPTSRVLFTWRWTIPWCRTSSTSLYIGDFNGDRREDILCHDWRNGRLSFRLASARGNFMSDSSRRGTSSFCRGSPSRTKLYVGDFNGDRRSDLLCYRNRGNLRDTVRIIYAASGGDFSNSQNVEVDMDWCATSDVRLRQVVDVDGDNRDDLVCYDRNNQLRVAVNRAYLYFP